MISSFFNSTNHDRLYSAEDFAEYFSKFVGNGVFAEPATSLQITSSGGLSLNAGLGSCFINGYMGRVTGTETVTISEGDGTYSRYDLVVARLDFEQRDIHIEVIEGEAAEEPVQPTPVRNALYYDLVLAVVTVPANAIDVSNADITDTRFDRELCGIVTGAVDSIDTTDLFAQYEAAWDLLVAGFSGSEADVIAAWAALNAVKTINGKLPVDGNINLKVEDLPDKTGLAKIAVLFDGSVAANVDMTLTESITNFEYIAFSYDSLGTAIDGAGRIVSSEFIAAHYGAYLRLGCSNYASDSLQFINANTIRNSQAANVTVLGINRF